MINPVTSETMNWLIVVVAGVFVIGAINWLVSGQYYFTGPKRSPYASVPYHESKAADVEGTVANQSD